MRSNFLKDTNEVKEKQIIERKKQKKEDATLEIIKNSFESMMAGINYLVKNSKKTGDESFDTNKVKALELKATNERVNMLEETIKDLLKKIEEQNIRLSKIEEKNVAKELFPPLDDTNKAKDNQPKKGKNIPTPQVGNVDLNNETLNYAKVTTKRIPGYVISDEQKEKINDNIKEKNKDNIKVPANKDIISLEEKKKRIERNLDLMSRTIGLRLGKDNMIDMTVQALSNCNKINSKLSNNDKRISAIKALLQGFAINDLQMNANDWKKIKIENMEEVIDKNNDIVNVTFQTQEDIAAVNSKFINIPIKSRNKIFQFVPKACKQVYKAYESAAYQLRFDENNSIRTKIRPGKSNFYLLVKKKTDQTPWSKISPTFVDIDKDIDFDVGEISEEDKIVEDKEYENRRERIKRSKIQQTNFRQNNRVFDLPDNLEEIERLIMTEDFNITEADLTIQNNSNSNNYMMEDNDDSINKRQRSSSPIFKSNNKSKQMRKANNKHIENNHE